MLPSLRYEQQPVLSAVAKREHMGYIDARHVFWGGSVVTFSHVFFTFANPPKDEKKKQKNRKKKKKVQTPTQDENRDVHRSGRALAKCS